MILFYDNIKRIGLMFGFLAAISSCIDEIPMIDPPKPKGDNEDAFVGYFVKEDGIGSGLSWDDAMSPARFRSMFTQGFKDGDEIYIAGGTYYVGELETEFLDVSKGIVIKGGFDPRSSGYNTEITYPSEFETIISGDINKNGKADIGDCHLMEVSSQIPAKFYGITFKHGYLEAATHNERPGIFVNEGAYLELNYCKILDCESKVTLTNNSAGGAGLALYCGHANLFQTIISGNIANNRGGAIRLMGENLKKSSLYLDACLLSNNETTGILGGAIQAGANSAVYMNNTTIADNSAKQSGAAINSDALLVMVNSTVVNNYCTASHRGHDVRCASNEFYVVNSIIVGDENRMSTGANICVDGDSFQMSSSGYNILGVVGGKGTYVEGDNDQTRNYYNDVFGSNVLADNGGYSQTIALKNSNWSLAPIAIINRFVDERKLPFDVWVDQRGVNRNISSGFYPGACEFVK